MIGEYLKRKDLRRIFTGIVSAVAGTVVATPLVIQADRFVEMPLSGLMYVVVMVAVHYHFGIGPAIFSLLLAMASSSYFLLDPKGCVWPVFRTEDQVHLAALAILTLPATGAVSLLRRSVLQSSSLAQETAVLASLNAMLQDDLKASQLELNEVCSKFKDLELESERLGAEKENLAQACASTRSEADLLHHMLDYVVWFKPETAVERILEQLIPAVEAEMGSVWTYNLEGVSISMIAERGYLEGLLRPKELLYIPHDGLLHRILASGAPFCGVPDTSGPFLRLTYASGARSLVVMPLKTPEGIIGFLSAASTKQDGFAPDMRVMSFVANLLTLVLQTPKQTLSTEQLPKAA